MSDELKDPCPGCFPGGTCDTAGCGRKQSSELMAAYGMPDSRPKPGWTLIPNVFVSTERKCDGAAIPTVRANTLEDYIRANPEPLRIMLSVSPPSKAVSYEVAA